jgi:Leucine-rich repeat (LRR) protein
MKKTNILIIMLMAMLTVQAQKVTFASPEVEAAIREHLELAEDADVLQIQTDTITRLDLSGLALSDISDVTSLPAVEELDLSGNAVGDLFPLLALEKLRRLDLSNNGLEDINVLAFTSSDSIEVNVALNHINDFSYFFRPMDCQLTLVGMDSQMEDEEQYLRVYQLYSTFDENEKPMVVYRGYTNMSSNAVLSCGTTNVCAVMDGDTYEVMPAVGSQTTKVILSNGNYMDSTYVVPVRLFPVNGGETITIETDLPEYYHIVSACAQKGTITVDGTRLSYTAPEETTPDCLSFCYYEGSQLRGYGRLYTGLCQGDVNGDGDVDIADAVCIVNHVVGKTNTSFNAAAADVNGDGDIDIADAVRIVNLVVGKIQ